jgi:hypothetical protein
VGRLDARLETQLAALERAIFNPSCARPDNVRDADRQEPRAQKDDSGARRV